MPREPVFSTTPHPTYRVVYPTGRRRHDETLPSGMRIVGWWVYHPPEGCCTAPDPGELSFAGWASSVALVVLCWPLTCIPCFLSGCYEGYQVPVYGRGCVGRPLPAAVPSAPPAPDAPLPVAYPVAVDRA